MNKYYISLVLFLAFVMNYAQEKKFQINFSADTGFSKVEFNEKSFNTSTSGALLSLQYGVSKFFNLETGISYFKSQGDFTSNGDSNYMENQYLCIPLGLRTKVAIGDNEGQIENQKFSFLVGGGLYINHLMKSKIDNVYSESSVGWNLGAYGNLGIHIQANNAFSLGVGLKTEQDFSEIEKDNSISIKQNRNIAYIGFGVRL